MSRGDLGQDVPANLRFSALTLEHDLASHLNGTIVAPIQVDRAQLRRRICAVVDEERHPCRHVASGDAQDVSVRRFTAREECGTELARLLVYASAADLKGSFVHDALL